MTDYDQALSREINIDAVQEMAAFDALPPDFQNFVRAANQNWSCIGISKRVAKSPNCRRGWYGLNRLLKQYQAEDVIRVDSRQP